ncbi:hypothetical protein Fmac_025998 [Flemingia macrophylla]|uniref:Transposase n=1 Tax=Flemingia macrophylla TaxID=520843 RepID=A0ABD1LDL8_9FABA
MPKVKRFRNPQKSTPQPQCVENPLAQASPSVEAQPIVSSPSVEAQPMVSSPLVEAQPHVVMNPSPTNETSSQQSETSTQHVGRESSSYWTVDAIDLEGAVKKIKVKVRGVNNLPRGERIIVEFDEVGMAIGEGQGVLAGYCGTLATDDNLFSINFERWSGKTGMPNTYFLECFKEILQPRFCFRTGEASAERYCKLTLGRKWAAHRQNLWNEFYDPTKTKNEIISNVPTGIDRTQWAHFVTYRLKPETLEICKKNKDNRNKQVIPHTGGSKPISRRRHEMFLETGQLPSRGKLYIETHKRKDGSFVNDAAKAIAEQIEVGLAHSTTNESEVSPNDVVGRVLGPEHSGRVRCMGLGAAPTNSFRNTRLTATSSSCSNQWQQKYTNLESQVQTTLGALKAYMIMKEGKIPDELVVFFDPQPQQTSDANEPESPLGTRGSSGASNI